MKEKKFLIVGAGIAGISAAWHLIKEGHQVKILDSGKNRSTKIAAGLINPMVFRRMTKSWRLDEFMPYLKEFYNDLEQDTNSTFFHPITIRRIFSSEQERQFWLDKENNEEFSPYLNKINSDDDNFTKADCPHGTGRVNQSFFVEVETFLKSVKSWLSDQRALEIAELNYLDINPQELTFKDEIYQGIIFCEGVETRNNPWFKKNRVNDTKGETLTIQSDFIPENESLNRKCFVLPLGNKTFKVGATYVWNTHNDEITEDGKHELQKMLTFITDKPYEIIKQEAGIRPTTPDRRPVMGQHPEFEGIYLFNGLGTKGFMMAPLLSKELVDHILNQTPLNQEVNLLRQLK